MARMNIEAESKEIIPKIETFKEEIDVYCGLFVQASLDLKEAKESTEILDVEKLKLIFGEVNIKKEWLIMSVYEMSYEEYQEIEQYLSDKFTNLTGMEKRAFAELKAGILNAKAENFIV